MKTDILLENMSNSIAYWYTKLLNTNKCETIFPIDHTQEELAYKLLRIGNNDADIIISPKNKIYQISKDVFFEVKKQSYMFYLKDMTTSNIKKQLVNSIQSYRLNDENVVKMRKYTRKMYNDGIKYSIIIFKLNNQEESIKNNRNIPIQEICKILSENVRSISYLNSGNGQIIRGADIVEIVDEQTIILLLSNIDRNCTEKKVVALVELVKDKFDNLAIKTHMYNSSDSNYYGEIQDNVENQFGYNSKGTAV